MYSDVVLGIEISHFEKHLERAKAKRGVKQDGMSLRCFGDLYRRNRKHLQVAHDLVSSIAWADGLKYPSQLTMQAFRRGLRAAR